MERNEFRITNVQQSEDEYRIEVLYSLLEGGRFVPIKTKTVYLIRKEVEGFWFLHFDEEDDTRMLSAEQLQNHYVVSDYILKAVYLISISEKK